MFKPFTTCCAATLIAAVPAGPAAADLPAGRGSEKLVEHVRQLVRAAR